LSARLTRVSLRIAVRGKETVYVKLHDQEFQLAVKVNEFVTADDNSG